jgi:ABC-type Zn uptake system ZnuABC Zn-binding protein ZnuA
MRSLALFLTALTVVVGIVQTAQAQETAGTREESIVVLTALPATYSISSALVENTSITVGILPERPRPMSALGNYFESRAEQLSDQFGNTQAVVTIGKLWDEDPLFTAARGGNISVINIDASKPWSTTLEGVSVAVEPNSDVPWTEDEPGDRVPSVYFWLSLANGVRVAEIIASDFRRLSPADSVQIDRNLADYRQQLLELKREYEVKLATLLDLTVFALAPEFVYLTSDMGLYVDGYFFKQDIDWTDGDLENFESYLKNNDIKVAIHKWKPAEPIQAAIDRAETRLVVLDMIDLGIVEDGRLREDSFIELMRANLEALYVAFSEANPLL